MIGPSFESTIYCKTATCEKLLFGSLDVQFLGNFVFCPCFFQPTGHFSFGRLPLLGGEKEQNHPAIAAPHPAGEADGVLQGGESLRAARGVGVCVFCSCFFDFCCFVCVCQLLFQRTTTPG